jgi:hypothetical protein
LKSAQFGFIVTLLTALKGECTVFQGPEPRAVAKTTPDVKPLFTEQLCSQPRKIIEISVNVA